MIKSLGKIGSKTALKALNSVHPDDERTARQLSFARTAIGLRTQPAEVDIEENLGIQWNDFTASPVKATEVRKQIGNIWGGTYGIELNPEYGLEFHCGASKHLVFLNKSLQKGAFAKNLQSEKMIAGLVALVEDASHLVIRYILFSIPDENSVRLAIARTDGSILFTGDTTPDRKGLHFTIDRSENTSLRIDYARVLSNQSGFYISFGESFQIPKTEIRTTGVSI